MKSNTPRYGRLLKLASFLEKLPKKKFDFNHCVLKRNQKGCGTVCCAIGWTPAIFPKLIQWDDECLNNTCFSDIGQSLFNISDEDVSVLFVDGFYHQQNGFYHQQNHLTAKSTAKEVAAHIREWVKNKRKS